MFGTWLSLIQTSCALLSSIDHTIQIDPKSQLPNLVSLLVNRNGPGRADLRITEVATSLLHSSRRPSRSSHATTRTNLTNVAKSQSSYGASPRNIDAAHSASNNAQCEPVSFHFAQHQSAQPIPKTSLSHAKTKTLQTTIPYPPNQNSSSSFDQSEVAFRRF